MVYGMCPNYEMVMFQSQTLTPQYLDYVINFYVTYSTLLNLLRPYLTSA